MISKQPIAVVAPRSLPTQGTKARKGSSGMFPKPAVLVATAGLCRVQASVAPATLIALMITLLLAPAALAQYTESVLHSFTGGSDGGTSEAGLIFDSQGNLYGTTLVGGNMSDCGSQGCGTVFELSPPSGGSGPWTETVLHTFTGPDGVRPHAGLIFDAKGNLYGATTGGGVVGWGVVFELSPPSGGSGSWNETVLFSFCGGTAACSITGDSPYGGLVLDSLGNLYGTASGGGANNFGLVFELSPPSSGSGPWTETVLYNFCAAINCADGEYPEAGLMFDSHGNLYGTTTGGGYISSQGGTGFGVVFELSPPSSGKGAWTESVLYDFCSAGGSSCTNGYDPVAGLIFDSQGNLYGNTQGGGSASNCGVAGVAGCGVVFELKPPGSGSAPWTENVLHSFTGGSDGNFPDGSLIFDSQGNLYGTAAGGGDTSDCEEYGCGVAFELRPPSGGSGPWTETVLHTFTGGSDGSEPEASLIFDSHGNLYGTTGAGGADIYGVVFELTPNTATAVSSSINPSTAGEAVTFSAIVSGGASPTGTVSFTSNGAIISGCPAVTLASGEARCTTAFGAKGSYSIVATYSGDSKNAGCSGTLTQVVGATTTALTSSLNPSTSGDSVTVTATIAPAGPPIPTGTVNFTSLGTALSGCTDVTLSASRTAECTTSALPVGTDAIVASYSGDSNYLSSTGTFSQLVNPTPTPVQFVPVNPCRVVDTRTADGPFGGPELAAGVSRSFTIPSGPCAGIPSTAIAYSLNVTVVPPAPLGYLTIWPAGEGQPTVSTLNSLDGRVKANAAIVPAGTSGAVSVYVNNASNVLLDIDGYFAASSSSSLEFYPLTPCRVADTRRATGPLGGPSLVAATERDFPILSSTCSVPSTAMAYSLNFTVVPPATGDALDYLTVWPEGESRPVVSTLNNFTGTIVANAAIVPAGTSGGVAVYPSNATNLLIDVNGYFAAPGTGGYNLYTLTPCRVLDTRKTTGAFSNTTLVVNVSGSACAPSATDKAYVFNATAIPTGDLGYLTLWPDGETQPVVSTLNAEDGAITSNMAIVPNSDGKTDAYASGTTQLVLDISAYFAP